MSAHIDIQQLWGQLWENECYLAPLPELDGGDWAADDHEFRLHTDYSGRAMYGKKCIGLEGPSAMMAAAHLAAAVAAVLDIAIHEVASELRSDSMGQASIVYLPDYQGIATRAKV